MRNALVNEDGLVVNVIDVPDQTNLPAQPVKPDAPVMPTAPDFPLDETDPVQAQKYFVDWAKYQQKMVDYQDEFLTYRASMLEYDRLNILANKERYTSPEGYTLFESETLEIGDTL